jgi:TolB protein
VDRAPPDGTQIAFTSLRTEQRQIWIMPAAGEPATQLTNHPLGAWDSDWSPDGTMIAFVMDFDHASDNDTWSVPATGGAPVRLSQHDDGDYFPDWSADGTQIFFTSNRVALPSDIWDPTPVRPAPPDGTQIAFTSNRSGSYQVWVMPTSGEPATQLTFEQNAGTASWSPDGTQIAFLSLRSGGPNIWVVTLDTAGVGPATAAAAGPLRLAVSPNPFSNSTEIRLPAMAGTASLRVIDIAGRLVRELMPPTGGSASREQTVVVWDGRDDRGRAVPRGVYFLVLESESSRASGRVIRMR